jgi:hypothetical protein
VPWDGAPQLELLFACQIEQDGHGLARLQDVDVLVGSLPGEPQVVDCRPAFVTASSTSPSARTFDDVVMSHSIRPTRACVAGGPTGCAGCRPWSQPTGCAIIKALGDDEQVADSA